MGGHRGLLRLDECALHRVELLVKLAVTLRATPRPAAASCSISPSGLQMSKRLPATTRSSTPMSCCTTGRSRPLTTQTQRFVSLHRVRMLGDQRVLRAVDDRRERAVVVQEDGRPPAPHPLAELLVIRERVRQIGDAGTRGNQSPQQFLTPGPSRDSTPSTGSAVMSSTPVSKKPDGAGPPRTSSATVLQALAGHVLRIPLRGGGRSSPAGHRP